MFLRFIFLPTPLSVANIFFLIFFSCTTLPVFSSVSFELLVREAKKITTTLGEIKELMRSAKDELSENKKLSFLCKQNKLLVEAAEKLMNALRTLQQLSFNEQQKDMDDVLLYLMQQNETFAQMINDLISIQGAYIEGIGHGEGEMQFNGVVVQQGAIGVANEKSSPEEHAPGESTPERISPGKIPSQVLGEKKPEESLQVAINSEQLTAMQHSMDVIDQRGAQGEGGTAEKRDQEIKEQLQQQVNFVTTQQAAIKEGEAVMKQEMKAQDDDLQKRLQERKRKKEAALAAQKNQSPSNQPPSNEEKQ